MQIIYFLIFLLIFLAIYFGMHYYVLARIISGLGFVSSTRMLLRIFFIIAGASFPIGEFLVRRFPVYSVVYFGSIWLGVISISVTVFLLKDLAGIFLPLAGRQATIITLLLIMIISVFSIYNVSRGEIIREVTIKVGKLPRSVREFSIVQLSDVHLDTLRTAKWFSKIVDRANELNPDLIVITGDLIGMEVCDYTGFCDNLRRLKAKYGVFAVTGNHEYYVGIDKFMKFAGETNINVLRNEKRSIGGIVELAGIDYYGDGRFTKTVPELGPALKDCDFKKPVILLSHQPDAFTEAASRGVDLQLSGHTHAGQLPPMDAIVMFYFKYPTGLYKKASSYLYTTSGTGTWGPPMRTFSRSEIVRIKLIKETSQ